MGQEKKDYEPSLKVMRSILSPHQITKSMGIVTLCCKMVPEEPEQSQGRPDGTSELHDQEAQNQWPSIMTAAPIPSSFLQTYDQLEGRLARDRDVS